MRDYTIYTGMSRTSKTWRSWTCSWPQLVERLRIPQRTPETFAEYKAAGKAQQGKIKDVGGFVGGVLKNGQRSASAVLERSVITLDADSPCSDFLERCKERLASDFAVYSTHSHSKETPRFRLIIPADRGMTPEEYQAVSRLLAYKIDIDSFDDSTYEPSRLMYWPSASSDADFVFESRMFIGPLEIDGLLGEYADWRDCSQWPTSSRVAGLHEKAKKQADPLEKGGVIGAFCKSYTITEAIAEFLPAIYKPTGMPNRWTYSLGSTFGGLVVYDNKFAYSNHGTDPAGGKLCNAFDLVRIHLFGDSDVSAVPETPTNKLPSFREMSDLVTGLDKVKSILVSEKMADAEQAFASVPEKSPDTDWLTELELDRTGKIRDTAANVRVILGGDPKLRNMVYKDEFESKLRLNECPP